MKNLQALAVLFFAIHSGSLFATGTHRKNEVGGINKLRSHKAQKAVSHKNAGMDTTSPFKSPLKLSQQKRTAIETTSVKLNFN